MEFCREIPVRHRVDVFVAGGGPAGVAAAVTAAQQGARAYLAEANACFGGAGTAGIVPNMLWFSDGVNQVSGGIGEEIRHRLWDMGGIAASGALPVKSLTVKTEVVKRLLDKLVSESGTQFAFMTTFLDVEKEDDRINAVVCHGKSGLFAIKAKVFVDCTGDGDLAARGGASFEKGDEKGHLQPGTLCSIWTQIDWESFRAEGVHMRDRIPQAYKDGVFTHDDRQNPGIKESGASWGTANMGQTFGVDGTDERSITEALVWARQLLTEYDTYLKGYYKGFDDMELVATGSMLGIRETRRIAGDYILTLKDMQAKAVFNDEIGRYGSYVDLHPVAPVPDMQVEHIREGKATRLGKGETYGIPYRTLTPAGLKNVLVAGRCISTDRPMQGSVRLIPCCFITGQAAGAAAAMAAANGADVRGIDVGDLQRRLTVAGGFLPNCPA